MPTDKLLRKYSLTQLHDIVVALKSGNIKVSSDGWTVISSFRIFG